MGIWSWAYWLKMTPEIFRGEENMAENLVMLEMSVKKIIITFFRGGVYLPILSLKFKENTPSYGLLPCSPTWVYTFLWI